MLRGDMPDFWRDWEAQRWQKVVDLLNHGNWQGSPRQRDYLRAHAKLQKQPRTEQGIREAGQIFARLAEENPDDPIGIASEFYRIRSLHIYSRNTDLSEVRAAYADLYETHSNSFYGRQAFVRYLMLLLYGKTAAETAALEQAGALLETFPSGHARRDGALLLAEYHKVDRNDPAKALTYFTMAINSGLPASFETMDYFLMAGSAGWESGNWQAAIDYYRQFLEVSNSDPRDELVRNRLEAAEKILSGYPVDPDDIL
jgi:tetratricopeptide (TPR) repeat protein